MSTTPSDSEDPEARTVITAAPPVHTNLLISVLVTICLFSFPSRPSVDEILVGRDIFTQRLYPESMSAPALLYIRFLFALIVLAVTVTATLSPGSVLTTTYKEGSQLQSVTFRLKGWKLQCSYTAVSWNLLGLAFLMMTILGVREKVGSPLPPWLYRVTYFLYEVTLPNTLLVASIVKYSLWPKALKDGASTAILRTPRALMCHNANVIMAATEIALMGGIPIQWSHVSLPMVYGLSYYLFSLFMVRRWEPSSGPQFIYFFLDTTVPGLIPTVCLLVLVAIMVVFYSIFVGCSTLLDMMGGGVLAHVSFVLLLSSAVCRFRD